MTTRREAVKTMGLAAAASGIAGAQAPAAKGPFALPPLAFAYDALEPHIDAKTVEIHHDRHHATYVNNLNAAVANFPEVGKRSIEDLLRNLMTVPEAVRAAVRNQGGGHANHALYWEILAKNGGQPRGELAKAIEQRFGGLQALQEQVSKASIGQFGSGWGWLCVDEKKQLVVEATPNQDSPLSSGHTPLLTVDVWEHAYYLKYQNRRADYVNAIWNVINWDLISDRYSKLV